MVKANVGGSGPGLFALTTSRISSRAATKAGSTSASIIRPWCKSSFPHEAGHITRVELLGGKFLYAIKVHTTGDTFNLCPADICQRSDGVELQRSACPIDAPKTGLKVEAYTPPDEVIDACEEIMHGVELTSAESST